MKFLLTPQFTIAENEDDHAGKLIGVLWFAEPLTEDQAAHKSSQVLSENQAKQIRALLQDCVATTLCQLNASIERLTTNIYKRD